MPGTVIVAGRNYTDPDRPAQAPHVDAAGTMYVRTLGQSDVAVLSEPALAAARAGTAFCRKVNGKVGINAAPTVLTDAGLLRATAAGYRDVITCLYAYLSTFTDSCEFEIGYTVNADGTGVFTPVTMMFGLDTGAASSVPSPSLTMLSPPIVVTPAMGGAWTIRAQTNDAGATVTFGMNGWREPIT